MSAYMLLDIEVHDPDAYARYVEKAPATVAKHGGRYLVRGGSPKPLTGGWEPARIVLLEFPSAGHMERWLESPEYQELLPLRLGSTTSRAVALEGVAQEAP